MGYLHRWEWVNQQPFSLSFIRDVQRVITDHQEIMRNVLITDKLISFNGKDGHGCETFMFRSDVSGGSVKTGRFDVASYDLVVSSILLLARAEYGKNIDLQCDGLMTVFVNPETLKVSRFWEAAIDYVEKAFGYTFQRTLAHDEYNQEVVRFQLV